MDGPTGLSRDFNYLHSPNHSLKQVCIGHFPKEAQDRHMKAYKTLRLMIVKI